MKLATLKDETRDGTLIVVSRDLQACDQSGRYRATLQAALDDWSYVSPQLTDRYDALNRAPGSRAFDFDVKQCASPLPRAYQWADGSAYLSHVELVRKARGAEMPPVFLHRAADVPGRLRRLPRSRPTDPRGRSDLGHRFRSRGRGDHRRRAHGHPAERRAGIRLLMLANDVSLRDLIPAELAKSFGFFQSQARARAFSPVALTPDELGEAWRRRSCTASGGQVNGAIFGRTRRGRRHDFRISRLIAHAARTRAARGRHHRRFRHRLQRGSSARLRRASPESVRSIDRAPVASRRRRF